MNLTKEGRIAMRIDEERAKLKWTIRKDKRGKYRARAVAPNGKITFASTQGYVRRGDCVHNARLHGYPK